MLDPIQNGGLTAPTGPARGLGSARRPRPITRRRSARGQKIGAIVKRAQTAGRLDPGGEGQVTLPRELPPAASRISAAAVPRPQATATRRRIGPGVDGAVQADLGRQLSRRVTSGVIDQSQAEKVARDRALLERAYGPNWRVKVFGDKGYVQRTRRNLAQNPEDPQVKALYDQLMQLRADALEHARGQKRRPTVNSEILL